VKRKKKAIEKNGRRGRSKDRAERKRQKYGSRNDLVREEEKRYLCAGIGRERSGHILY
jgi:hypothetical protein